MTVSGAHHRRSSVVAGCLLFVAVVTACTAPSATVTARDVMVEREIAVEAESRAEFDAFLAEHAARLAELTLPQPSFQGVIAREKWGEAVIECVERLDTTVRVSRLEGGFGVNYFGVPDETYDRVRWAIESCMAQYGSTSLEPPPPGPVEAAWITQDTTLRLLPCLRALGYSPFSAPSAALARVSPLCPPTELELVRQLENLATRP